MVIPMKQIFIFFLLFILTLTLVILLDILQSLGISESLNNFNKIKQKMNGEKIILLFFFFMPLIISKAHVFLKNKIE